MHTLAKAELRSIAWLAYIATMRHAGEGPRLGLNCSKAARAAEENREKGGCHLFSVNDNLRRGHVRRGLNMSINKSIACLFFLSLAAFQGCRKKVTDVSTVPRYNFSSFVGSQWRLKEQCGLVDVKLYTGDHVMMLLTPEGLSISPPPGDSGHRLLRYITAGSHLRVESLQQDNGQWGGFYVTGTLNDGPYAGKTIYLDNRLIVKNKFLSPVSSSSDAWSVNPRWLEK
jgi:hypothetical protein